MKVMFVNGSSHLRGTTMAAIEEMEKVFRAEGIETEVIQVGGKPIADCLQCNVCGKTGKCVFTDDGVNEFVEKAKDADGFVFATPVYFAHPSGRIFDFLDRAFYSSNGYENFKFKPGANCGNTYQVVYLATLGVESWQHQQLQQQQHGTVQLTAPNRTILDK